MMDWCRQNKVAVILLVLGIVFLCTGAAQEVTRMPSARQ